MFTIDKAIVECIIGNMMYSSANEESPDDSNDGFVENDGSDEDDKIAEGIADALLAT